MISDIDADGSGNIDFTEFLNMMTVRISDTNSKEDLQKVFRLFDDEKQGAISIKNLRRSFFFQFLVNNIYIIYIFIFLCLVARELGENMEDYELQEMIERADSNKDGLVTFEDFYNIMTKQ